MTYTVMIRKRSTYIKADEWSMILDGEGRFRQWFDGDRLIKRGLGHDYLLKEILREKGKRFIKRKKLDHEEKQAWSITMEKMLRDVIHDRNTTWLPSQKGGTFKEGERQLFIDQVSQWSDEALRAHGEQFLSIYKPISILPPDQYQAVVLQISEGCSYNKCTFCNFYRDRPFRIKGLEETREHIKSVKQFFGDDLWRRKTIFLGDANAIIIPQKRLIQLLEVIESEFSFDPSVEQSMEGIYAFMDIFGLQYKSLMELEELHKHHVKTIYIGLETGDEALRRFIGKQGTKEEVQKQIQHVKEAGIHVGVIIMVGVGGEPFRLSHRKETIELISQLQLDNQDMVFLSPFVAHKDLPYVKDMEQSGYTVMDEEDIDHEMALFKAELKKVTEAKVSNYFIDEFIY